MNFICYNKKKAQRKEGFKMAVSYNKLWKLLIDKNMKKGDLRVAANMSPGTMAKLGKNQSVTTDVLERICCALKCDIGDIVEIAAFSDDTDEGRSH